MYLLQFDGAANPNPGPASGAYVLFGKPEVEDEYLVRKVIQEGYKYIPNATNNEAEYTGLILGLEKALELGIQQLKIEGDSNLVVNQVQGLWKVKEPRLVKYNQKAKELYAKFTEIRIYHIPREENKDADALSKEGIEIKKEVHRHN
jgi:ribonuclease HI